MTVYRKIVKLQMTHVEAERYTPPVGIDVFWLEWDHAAGTVIAEFVTSDKNPDPSQRKNMAHIMAEIIGRKIADVPTHAKSPDIALRFDAIIDDPQKEDMTKYKRVETRNLLGGRVMAVGIVDEG